MGTRCCELSVPRMEPDGTMLHCLALRKATVSVHKPVHSKMGHTKFTTSGAHDVIAITSAQKNDLCTKEIRDRPKTLEEVSLSLRKGSYIRLFNFR